MKSKRAVFLFCLSLLPLSGFAGARRFTYVYEATTTAPGQYELENWVTWKTGKPEDHGFDRVEFRHELEFGLTPRLQVSLYLADWFYQDERGHSRTGYTASAVEFIYNFSNPVTDPLGFSVYEEIRGGDELFELESKIIAQKNFGRWIVAYNAALEATWEGNGLNERNGEFAQSAGVTYEISPRWSVGGELLHEIGLPNWESTADSAIWIGPNASVRVGSWWATMTALVEATEVAGEPEFQLRTIVGYSF